MEYQQPAAVERLLGEIQACAARIVQHGWDEATGGNLSVACPACPARWTTALAAPAGLDAALATPGPPLLATTSGKHWRTLASTPASRLCYTAPGTPQPLLAHPAAAQLRPTLELRIHLAVQQWLRALDWDSCAVLHLHPPALLTLSVLPPALAAEALAALPRLFPEGGLLLGETIPLIMYLPPGSPELAAATAQALTISRLAVWQNHGVITAAPSLVEALDVLETAELAAEVYLRCRQVGYAPQLLTADGSPHLPADTTR